MTKLKLINNIEIIRRKNNKYWMDLLRLAFKSSPKEAKKIIKKINDNDKKISSLLGRLCK
jgi:hypothetical protein